MSPLLYQLSYTARAAKLTAYEDRVKRSVATVPGIVPVSHLAGGVLQIGRGDNVIAIEYRARSVPASVILTASGTPERMRFRGGPEQFSCVLRAPVFL